MPKEFNRETPRYRRPSRYDNSSRLVRFGDAANILAKIIRSRIPSASSSFTVSSGSFDSTTSREARWLLFANCPLNREVEDPDLGLGVRG